MIRTRLNPVSLVVAILFLMFSANLTTKDIKVVAPESVGLSSERLARLSKAMQDNAQILGKKTVELMTSNNLPPQIPDVGFFGGTGHGLGVLTMISPAMAGILGSPGQFFHGGAASTYMIVDPKEDLVALYFTQLMSSDFSVVTRFQTLMYQTIID